VESVAWITEIKNTLSAVFYLSAAIAWLRYREQQKAGGYALAFGLFLLALCSKTVTATLPAALLVIEEGNERQDVALPRQAPAPPPLVRSRCHSRYTVVVERRGGRWVYVVDTARGRLASALMATADWLRGTGRSGA
jgi:hypothetical protein